MKLLNNKAGVFCAGLWVPRLGWLLRNQQTDADEYVPALHQSVFVVFGYTICTSTIVYIQIKNKSFVKHICG